LKRLVLVSLAVWWQALAQDNVKITEPATGTTVASDNVTGVHFQYFKLADGTLDSSNKLIVTAAGAAKVDGSAVTQPVSATALPLPAGAATESTLSTINGKVPALVGGRTPVDGSGVTQPVSGTVAATQSGAWSMRLQDGGGNAVDSATAAPAGSERGIVTRNIPSGTQTVAGTVTATGPLTDTQLRATPVPVTPPANQSTNVAQYNGATVGAGNPVHVTCVSGCSSAAVPVLYAWSTPDSVGGANKLHADIFNATGSGKIMKIHGIYPIIKSDVAVTGVVAIRFDILRTSAVGTGGTVAAYKSATADVAGGSISPFDTNNAALPAQLTARHLPTAGATVSEWIKRGACFPEETNQATYICSGQTEFLYGPNHALQLLTIREGQGVLIRQGAVASVNNIAFRVEFSLE
jgi:hypothetical protein